MERFCLGAGVYWLDFLCKNLAEEKLKGKGKVEVGNTGFFLQLVKNRGFALNKLDKKPGLVKGIHFLCMSVLAFYGIWAVLSRKCGKIASVGLALLLGGGASNLFDRVKRGYVVDYLGLPGIKKVVFNLSDLCIYMGIVLFILDE